MIPWLWYWAPQFHLPFGGDVAQRIEPETSWFFQGIRPGAGDPEVERQAFDVASYGRQLGLLTEVVLGLAGSDKVAPAKAAQSQTDLEAVVVQVEQIKRRHKVRTRDDAVRALEKLRQSDPDALRGLLARFAAEEAKAATKALR